MLRRLIAVGLLTVASLSFALRFRPPPSTTADLDELLGAIEVESELDPDAVFEETTYPSYAPVPTVVTTTIPPLPPGVTQVQSGFVRLGGRGVIQLEVTFDLGVMVDIEMIKTPTLSERAREINVETHPILRAEALENQTYRVHVVSGATETTIGWARALRDALDQADFCTLPGSKCDLPLR